MKLSLAYSPCPNDTFIFDALVHQKIDTEGLEFEVFLADVEELNQKATQGGYDITKLSYHAYAHLTTDYILLRAGSALGNNCGPLLVSSMPFEASDLPKTALIAIPGKLTTANFLLNFAFPSHQNRVEMLFSEIEHQVLSRALDAGLLIHENRFTYASRGLHKIMDLGEFWEQNTQLPIPLGGIVTRRAFEPSLQSKINRVLHRSVAFALQNPADSMEYVSQHAQEMDYAVMQQHIALYVNDYTLDFGSKGEAAIRYLFETVKKNSDIPTLNEKEYWVQ